MSKIEVEKKGINMENRNIIFNLGIFGNFEEIRNEFNSGKTRTRVVKIDGIKLRMDLGSTIHVYYQYTYTSKKEYLKTMDISLAMVKINGNFTKAWDKANSLIEWDKVFTQEYFQEKIQEVHAANRRKNRAERLKKELAEAKQRVQEKEDELTALEESEEE